MTNLASTGFLISRCPAFVLKRLSFSYPYKIRAVKAMLIAKLVNANNGIFNAFWRRNDHRPFPLHHASFHGNAHFRAGFRGMLASEACQANFPSCLRRVLSACNGQGTLADSLFAVLPAKMVLTYLFNRFRRLFCSQAGIGKHRKIKASLPERLQGIQPVLLACNQQFRKQDVFQHFKDEGIRAVLIPGILHSDAVVSIVAKASEVLIATPAEINGTPDVKLPSRFTCDAVNARCVRHPFVVECTHSYCLPKGGSLGFRSATNIPKTASIYLHSTTKPAPRLALCSIRL